MLSFDRLRNRFCSRGRAIERIIGLVFVSPWSFGDAHLTTMQNLRVAAARGLNPYRYAWFNASLLFPPDYRREHHTGFEEMAQSARSTPQDADAIEDRLQAILAFDARPTARSIECPTLICASEDDQLMPVWFARELAGLMPAAQLSHFKAVATCYRRRAAKLSLKRSSSSRPRTRINRNFVMAGVYLP